MNTTTIVVIIIVVLVAVGAIYFYWLGNSSPVKNNNLSANVSTALNMENTDKATPEPPKSPRVTLETNRGNITIELYQDDAPKTVANFVKLAKEKFYDGVKFHRVIKGFMIQGGDPLSKNDAQINLWGTGGPGYKFADELNPATKSYQAGYKRGVVAMANSGPNTNGSQFFIMHADYPLPNSYSIFGKVVSGIEVVDAIANSPTGPNDRPVTAVVITRAIVE